MRRSSLVPLSRQYDTRTVNPMWTFVVILLVVWAILAVVGFVFEGLLWLAIIGVILFVGTLIVGFIRQSRGDKKDTP